MSAVPESERLTPLARLERGPPSTDDPISIVVVESPEVVKSCFAGLHDREQGAPFIWLYCRWRQERFALFAERALRHVLAPWAKPVKRISYFVGYDEVIESERLALLAAYLRALPANATLTLVAPPAQQHVVLCALRVLQADNPRKVKLNVTYTAPPAVRLGVGHGPQRRWFPGTALTGLQRE